MWEVPRPGEARRVLLVHLMADFTLTSRRAQFNKKTNGLNGCNYKTGLQGYLMVSDGHFDTNILTCTGLLENRK